MYFCGVFSVIFFSIFSCVLATSRYKIWLPNKNLNNPANWPQKHVPCKNDRVILPESSPVLYLQKNLSIVELVLPKNGEIVLDGSIIFNPKGSKSSDKEKDCPGRDVQFVMPSPDNWFNPNNWCTASSEKGPCLNRNPLDLEQIPCNLDNIVFPNGNSYYVNLDTSDDINIGSMKFRGKYYDTDEFKNFITAGPGKTEFVRSRKGSKLPSVIIKEDHCDDITGCTCGNYNSKVRNRICALQKPQCPPVLCESPLRPDGACCKLCGAYLTLTFELGFSFTRLEDIVNSTGNKFMKKYNKTVFTSVSKGHNVVYVVLTDSHGGTVAKLTGKALNHVLTSEQMYAINRVIVDLSGKSISGRTDRHSGGGAGISGGAVAGILILILFIVVIIVAVYYLHKKRNLSKLAIAIQAQAARFKRTNEGSDIELRHSGYVDLPESVGGSRRPQPGAAAGFDNPMYDSTIDIGLTKEMMQPTSKSASNHGFDNPMYKKEDPLGIEEIKMDPSIKINPMYDATEGTGDLDELFNDPAEISEHPTHRSNPLFLASQLDDS